LDPALQFSQPAPKLEGLLAEVRPLRALPLQPSFQKLASPVFEALDEALFQRAIAERIGSGVAMRVRSLSVCASP
jgi:hypothetical protein